MLVKYVQQPTFEHNGTEDGQNWTMREGRQWLRAAGGNKKIADPRARAVQFNQKTLVDIWASMTTAERDAWYNFGINGYQWPLYGRPRHMHGLDAFISVSNIETFRGRTTVDLAPPIRNTLFTKSLNRLMPFALENEGSLVLEWTNIFWEPIPLIISAWEWTTGQRPSDTNREILIKERMTIQNERYFVITKEELEAKVGPYKPGLKIYLRSRFYDAGSTCTAGECCCTWKNILPPNETYVMHMMVYPQAESDVPFYTRINAYRYPEMLAKPNETNSFEFKTYYSQPNLFPESVAFPMTRNFRTPESLFEIYSFFPGMLFTVQMYLYRFTLWNGVYTPAGNWADDEHTAVDKAEWLWEE